MRGISSNDNPQTQNFIATEPSDDDTDRSLSLLVPMFSMADIYSWNISDITVSILFRYVSHRWVTSRQHLPPCPKGLPVFGYSCQIPAHKQWLKLDD